jgi:hypothetical protein
LTLLETVEGFFSSCSSRLRETAEATKKGRHVNVASRKALATSLSQFMPEHRSESHKSSEVILPQLRSFFVVYTVIAGETLSHQP